MEPSVKSAQKGKARAAQPGAENQRQVIGGLAYAVFFLGYCLLVGFWTEPRVQYFGHPAAFYFDQRFFKAFLIRPGGLVEYVSNGTQQFFQFNWLGATVITGITGMLVVGAWLLVRKVGKGAVGTLCLWPALALLLIQRQYTFSWLDVTLAFLGATWLAAAYAWLPVRNPSLRWLFFALFSLPGYAVLGGAFLVCALYCGLFELLARRRYLLPLAIWGSAAVLPLAGAWFFSVHLSDAYLLLLPFGLGHFSPLAASLPYAAIPLAMLVRVARPLLYPATAKIHHQTRPRASLRHLVEPGFFVLITVGVLVFGWNGNTQRLARITTLSHDRKWDRVLEQAQLLSAYEPSAISHINRALCWTGRLPYEMFRYPQKEKYDFWLSAHSTLDPHQCMVASDLLFEIGQVNRAERMAGEALELNGYLPDVLKRLADVNVLKGEPQISRIFLNILAKTPFYGHWATQRRRDLEADPKLSRDPAIQEVRCFALNKDHPFGMTTDQILLQCLQQNRSNRMAFEYLMAHYLLTRDLDNFVHYVRGAKVFNYEEIPTHFEEALLIAQKLKNAPLAIPDIKGKTPREETVQRFRRFNESLRICGPDLNRAKVEMLKEFGDTYWYYYFFESSGTALTLQDLFAQAP